MSQFEKLLDEFIQPKYLDTYTPLFEEPMVIFQGLLIINDFLSKKHKTVASAYTDKTALSHIYLQVLPKEYLVFPDEIIYIHEILMDYLAFLARKKILTKKQYLEMLEFMQRNKQLFLARMLDETYWSKEKLAQMQLIEEDFSESVLTNVEQSLKQLQKEIPKKKAKVIQFPSHPQETFFQLRIDLKDFKPFIWRKVLVSAAMTFADFHRMIQNIFEWDNEHLYLFQTPDQLIQASTGLSEWDSAFLDETVSPKDICLYEVFPKARKITYLYDFGEDWEHTIKLEQTFLTQELSDKFNQLPTEKLPVCIRGKNDAPADISKFEPVFIEFNLDAVNQRLFNEFNS